MDNRVGVIGIILENREESARRVNDLLSDFGELIVGRMGIPYKERGVSVISIIVDGSNDRIGALTGKLGNVSGVRVKVALVN